VANIDNDSENGSKVVLGSYTGLLRIIGTPSSVFVDQGAGEHKNAVILAELNLGFPILQVEANIFIRYGSNMKHMHGLYSYCF
jgi:hypothetical protein